MFGIKKLDIFILKNFLLIFVGAFFICLFVFMMQFTWRYVDELIGKGLSLEILVQFFWYMGITLVPTSLPLAVLLASLIAFGNMGERLELLAMKAAGVPLVRIMQPILCVVVLLTAVSFVFQNTASPKAQKSLRTLLISMKQTSPAVEIPEGVFYGGVPNVNLFVERKNAETGMLYQLIIYKTDQGFDRAQIVLADSGRMEVTADKLHLKLDLWNGEQFENLQSQGFSGLSGTSVPYDRETFAYKQLLIDFDSNFNMMDEDMLRNLATAKNMQEIEHDVDSMEQRLDSVGQGYYAEARRTVYRMPPLAKADSAKMLAAVAAVGLADGGSRGALDAQRAGMEGPRDARRRQHHTAPRSGVAPEDNALALVPLLLLCGCPARRHHTQRGPGHAHGHLCADIHLLLHHQYVGHEDGPRRLVGNVVRHVD